MIGAIIGDVVGSRFEFNNIKSKDFTLITDESVFTDDTVMTIAVMDWILSDEIKNKYNVTTYLQKWARKYPNAGYGGMFSKWIYLDNPTPYNSCGNGSAMRVSACGWAAQSMLDATTLAYYATNVTHNHPEGLKGAYVTAELIYMARMGKSKEEMKAYASEYYDLNLDYEELKKTYRHGPEICQVTLPQALYCFFISKDFEDCLRTTISIGGDCDTTAAISCAIAEAYYKYIPIELVNAVRKKLSKEMIDIIDRFSNLYHN